MVLPYGYIGTINYNLKLQTIQKGGMHLGTYRLGYQITSSA